MWLVSVDLQSNIQDFKHFMIITKIKTFWLLECLLINLVDKNLVLIKKLKTFVKPILILRFQLQIKLMLREKMPIQFISGLKKIMVNSTVPKWNFHKILINNEGKIQNTFNSFITPLSDKITKQIELVL